MSKQQLDESARKALRRIIGFLCFYSLLIVCGGLLFAAAAWATQWVLCSLIPSFARHLKIVALLLIGLIGLWAVTLLIGGALIRPLFIVAKRTPEASREIEPSDAPALFELIRSVAQASGTAIPKHVYLTADADAYVFFDASYWGLRRSAPKNLAVGMGLMIGLSQTEFKALLAHEFGHFSQTGMQYGSAVWMLSQMIDDLLNHRSRLDIWIEDCAKADRLLLKLFGAAAQSVLRGIRRLVWSRWLLVKKADLSLSRRMEFDADAAGARIAGIGAAISMLAKLPVIERRHALYCQLLGEFYREKSELVPDFWKGCEALEDLMSGNDGVVLKPGIGLRSLPANFGSASRLRIEDAWNTHPALRERIDTLRRLAHSTDAPLKSEENRSEKLRPALELIPAQLARATGLDEAAAITGAIRLAQSLLKPSPEEDAAVLSRFHRWAAGEFERFILPLAYEAYFDRPVVEFDLLCAVQSAEKAEPPNPFIAANDAEVREYAAACSDCEMLAAIADGRREAASLRYDDIVIADLADCDLREVLARPTALAASRKAMLSTRAKAIDEAVFKWLYAQSDPTEKQQLASAYCDLFYSQAFLEAAGDLAHRAQRLQTWLDRVNAQLLDAKRSEADAFMKQTEALMNDVTQLLPSIDWDALSGVADETELEALRATSKTFFADPANEDDDSVETKSLTGFAVNIVAVHEMLRQAASRFISRRAAQLRRRAAHSDLTPGRGAASHG